LCILNKKNDKKQIPLNILTRLLHGKKIDKEALVLKTIKKKYPWV